MIYTASAHSMVHQPANPTSTYGRTLQIAADHAATIAALEDRLKEAQRGASRLGDKARASAASAAVAERQRDEVEQQLEQLR